MDITSLVGLLLAWAAILASILMGGGQLSSFWDTASVIMVFGGGFAAMTMGLPLSVVMKTPTVFIKFFLNSPPNVGDLIKQIISLAETARREGLLALEKKMDEIKNPFIKLGVQMAIDGARPETVQEVLTSEIESMAGRHKEAKMILDNIGRYAPAFGMIGTLLGLIIMLGNMSDPSSIGAGMAVALLTTLYGAALSNASVLPMADKLAFASRQEILARDIIIKGVLAIQGGENPRVIEQRLNTYLPPNKRPKAT